MVAIDTYSPTRNFMIPGQLGRRTAEVLIKAQELASMDGFYRYVEIGSFKGHSLQPHIEDDECTRALSIDLRPEITPDERAAILDYEKITVDQMIRNLRRRCGAEKLEKLETLTDTSAALATHPSDAPYDLALIDGEHTNRAAFQDFLNVSAVMRPGDHIICFDDTHIVYSGVINAIAHLRHMGVPHRALFCQGYITVLLVGERHVARADHIPEHTQLTPEQLWQDHQEPIVFAHLRDHMPHLLAENAELAEIARKALG